MFAIIYEGCDCPEGTWNVMSGRTFDVDRDKIYELRLCNVCGKPVTKEKTYYDGSLMVHVLTDEEIKKEMMLNDFMEGELNEYFRRKL